MLLPSDKNQEGGVWKFEIQERGGRAIDAWEEMLGRDAGRSRLKVDPAADHAAAAMQLRTYDGACVHQSWAKHNSGSRT